MNHITLELPLPPRELSANGRDHWRKHAGVKAEYRKDMEALANAARQSAGWVAPARARIYLHYCTKGSQLVERYAPRDWDNAVAVFKSAQDALVLSGVLAGDSSKQLDCGGVSFDRTRGPFIRVTVERVGL